MWLLAQEASSSGAMELLIDRLFDPAVLIMLIPLVAVIGYSVYYAISALRGTPEEYEEIRAEVEQLRARVEKLENSHHLLNQQLAETRQV